MRVNAASLDIRDATTSTPGTLNDLTTDLIMANNNNNKCESFVMPMLYVCVLCASCGSSQCCVLHDLQFVNAGRGKSTPASSKAPNCRHRCSASTLLTCRDQQNQASGYAMLMT